MEFLVPLGIIIYITLAVISAVLKGLSTQPAPVSTEMPQPVEVAEERVPAAPASKEPSQSYREVELDDLPGAAPITTVQPASAAGREERRTVTKQDLRTAVVMSEILREPRARRPWPAR